MTLKDNVEQCNTNTVKFIIFEVFINMMMVKCILYNSRKQFTKTASVLYIVFLLLLRCVFKFSCSAFQWDGHASVDVAANWCWWFVVAIVVVATNIRNPNDHLRRRIPSPLIQYCITTGSYSSFVRRCPCPCWCCLPFICSSSCLLFALFFGT